MKVHIFGKEGCSKCATLKRRVSQLLEKDEYKDSFTVEYHDVMTLDGIVEFCKAECLNSNRIPALLVADDNGYMDSFRYMHQSTSADYAASVTYKWIGLQTDYDNGGVITPDAIRDVLDLAKSTKTATTYFREEGRIVV